MTISTDLAFLNTLLSFVPTYWLNWQILMAIFSLNFVDKDETTKVRYLSTTAVLAVIQRLSINVPLLLMLL